MDKCHQEGRKGEAVIVGNGLVASALKQIDRDDVVFFASGVAHSGCVDHQQFDRERTLLEWHVTDGKILVYISTCAISGRQFPPYFWHKKAMEDIARKADEYRIVRLPPVINSKNGLFRFISSAIKDGLELPVHAHALRRTITQEDIASSVHGIISESSGIYDVASREELPVRNIVSMFEQLYGKWAKIVTVDSGNRFVVNSSHLVGGEGYIASAIERHYAQ